MHQHAARRAILGVAAGFVLFASPLHAQTPIVTFDPTSGTGGINQGQNVGWQFDVTTGITVTGLGWFDQGGNGLSVGHELGLWDPSGLLLASTTVSAGTVNPLVGLFRTGSVAATFLAPGTGYIVGGLNSPNSTDLLASNLSTVSFLPYINFVDATFSNFTSSLERPTQFSTASNGFFGPGFSIAEPNSTVPEPATMTLLATGLVGLAGARRRRRRTD